MVDKIKEIFKNTPLVVDFLLRTKEEQEDLYSPWTDFGYHGDHFYFAMGKEETVCKAFTWLSLEQAKELYACLGRWIELMEKSKAA